MSFVNFFRDYGKAKAASVGQELIKTIAAWDPETTGQVQLDRMRAAVNETSLHLSEANQALAKERAETVAKQAEFNRLLGAVESLAKQAAEATDPARKAQLEQASAELLAKTEEVEIELKQEQEDEVQAQQMVTEWQKAFDELARKLKTAKRDVDTATRDIHRAEAESVRANAAEENAAARAGITSSMNNIDIATNAMKEAAAGLRAGAEAKRRTAEAIAGSQLTENPDVAAALAAADAQKGTALTVAERIARLKGGTAERAA